MANGSDRLGRWVWFTLKGKNKENVTLVVVYCPNLGYPTDSLTDVWLQQRTQLQEIALTTGDTRDFDPREQCLLDFKQWAEK